MREKSIVEFIEERLENGGIELPVFDPIALKLQRVLAKDDFSADQIALIIQKDQALASRILKMANSSFYTGLNPAKTIRDAIVRLGIKSIVNLVVAVTQQRTYNSLHKEFAYWMKPLWNHSIGVATAGKWLAERLGLNMIAEETFLAGLLHDIGKLLLLKIMEDLKKSGSVGDGISQSVVDDVLESMHSAQGEHLMRHLNMPEVYCKVVQRHHEPEVTADNVIINLVKLANLSCHKLGIGLKHDPALMLSTSSEAINLMASDLLLAELQVKLEEYQTSFEKLLGQ